MILFLLSLLVVPPQVLSHYECVGTDSGKKYELFLDTKPQGDNLIMVWNNGEQIQAIGLGIRVGDNLSVIYQTNKGTFGVASFKVTAGQLSGKWSAGDGKLNPETCTAGKPKRA